MAEDRKRHCWECLRRSLVCDFTRPECKRCSATGVICPGYNDTQPLRLRWLAPGRVKSRKRKPMNKDTKEITRKRSASPNDIISLPTELQTDLHVFVQATEYYNACIYPDLLHISRLGPNTAIYPITPPIFQVAIATHPDHIRLVIVCMTLSHRMNRARHGPECHALARNFFHYRGQLIRSLSDDIKVEHKCMSDLVIAGILTLLLVDAQQGASPHYRCHLDGVRKIIMLRGGIRSLAQSTGMVPLLLFVVFTAVMGDTSSPVPDLTMATSHLEELDFMINQYSSRPFAFAAYPTALFSEIIKINYLRVRASKSDPTPACVYTNNAYEILNRIHSFSAEQWAESMSTSHAEWVLLGNIHQAAVALYCILSLQSLAVLPQSSFLQQHCLHHAQHLHRLLSDALTFYRIERFIIWDLVVLGVVGVKDAGIRKFLREQLPELSHSTGTYAPLMAEGLLERFWASGETHWDACFDQPYTFAMNMSVDVSGLR
ncbi:fungal-specific transcription factor domain-containing protein [Aspergillus pseudotamarii]|uniref:Fungal-specific transcription factor domain-containing protein n=1 Tax=Aspergillus pseudotamarii TaxID=132259 RepID=A0A5N6T9K8_ASPPS|nr:fungal-specific transcription factor domain-containing protein [Aspergillus pseudotamarii]KAE8142861.1 fungal-specific transcription factor domain-containing protein [Aspergillus pseudotamarii]